MTVFDRAWGVAKADTDMWNEIYAPLYDVFGGRGRNINRHAIPLDFMQTKDITPERHYQGREPMDDEYIEGIMQDILEHGMMGRDSHWWHRGRKDLEEGRADFDRNKSGESHPGWVSIPNIGYAQGSEEGWVLNEGNHRLAALRRLGAPRVPVYANSSNATNRMTPYSADLQLGDNMKRWMGLSAARKEGDPVRFDDYGITASLGRRGQAIPPSFMFDQELVPGMGKLVPDLDDWENMPLNEARRKNLVTGEPNDPTGKYGEWQRNPKWRIQNET